MLTFELAEHDASYDEHIVLARYQNGAVTDTGLIAAFRTKEAALALAEVLNATSRFAGYQPVSCG